TESGRSDGSSPLTARRVDLREVLVLASSELARRHVRRKVRLGHPSPRDPLVPMTVEILGEGRTNDVAPPDFLAACGDAAPLEPRPMALLQRPHPLLCLVGERDGDSAG